MQTRQLNLCLWDVGQASPKTLSPEAMSDDLARELLATLYHGDFRFTQWQANFILNNHSTKHFTLKLKRVIYKMAFQFRIL